MIDKNGVDWQKIKRQQKFGMIELGTRHVLDKNARNPYLSAPTVE